MQIQPIGLAALAALAGSAFGQAGAADVDGVAQVAIDAWHYGEVEVARLLAEDAQDPRGLRPVRFAEKHANQQVTPADSGTLIDNGDGTLRWRLRLESTNGLSVNFGSLFDVPPSTVMTLRDADGNAVFRPITAADNQPHGELWTPVIPGRSLEVDVTVAADEWDDFEAGFWITDVNLGYRALDAAMAQALGERHQDRGIAPQDACLVDVACPEADPWRAQVNGVAAYTVNGFLTCSGSMLNNTAEDGTPYFYTAEHCGPQLSPASVVTYWNFQNSFCRPPGSTESGEIGDGEYDQPILGGATVVGTVNDADSTLLLLNNTPPDAYRVVYLGWERQAFASDSSVGISHPGVQEKRIAFDDDPVGYGVIDASSIPGFSSQLTIWQTVWELGGVNRGSSGSPLINERGRVIATASLAGPLDIPNYCPQQVTQYGSLDEAFAQSPAIAAALDPLATGQDTLDYRGFYAPACPGDANNDGETNVFDFNATTSAFGQTGLVPYEDGDVNGDGIVNVFDFNEVTGGFGCDSN